MLVIGNGRMITRDASSAFFENGAVAMDGNTIKMVGVTDEVKKTYPDAEFVGSGSGKSAFAEDCVVSFGKTDRIYIATMYPFDEESRKRVQRHRKMRQGKGFETVECYTGLDKIRLPENCTVLLECMSNLVANEMFQEEGAHENTVEAVLKGVRHIREQAGNLVIVTNEIFSEAADYQGETELYQEYLGQINQKIAEIADQVVEVVYGIPVYHKNKLLSGEG